MNFEQFKAQVIDEMRDRFPELDISLQEVSKLQGESYIGMAVRPENSNIAATTNLKAFLRISVRISTWMMSWIRSRMVFPIRSAICLSLMSVF